MPRLLSPMETMHTDHQASTIRQEWQNERGQSKPTITTNIGPSLVKQLARHHLSRMSEMPPSARQAIAFLAR